MFVPGSVSLQLWSMLGRFQVGMLPIALILYAVEVTDSFAIAGAATGAMALTSALFSPLKGRLIDSNGFAKILLPLMTIHTGAFVLILLLPTPVMLVTGSAILGASRSNITTYMRVVWRKIHYDNAELQAASASFEAAIAPFVFLAGPPLVGIVVSLTGDAAWGIIITALSTLVGTVAFALHHHTRAVVPTPIRGASSHLMKGLWLVIIAGLFNSLAFGAIEIAIPAICAQQGDAHAAGFVLGAFFLGGGLGGLLWGLRPQSSAHARTGIWRMMLGFAGGLSLFLLPIPWQGLLLCAPIAGIFLLRITLLTQTAIMESMPEHRATEGLGWWVVAYSSGVAIGNVTAGAIISLASIDIATGVAVLGALMAACVSRIDSQKYH